jgi:hypothetical protein
LSILPVCVDLEASGGASRPILKAYLLHLDPLDRGSVQTILVDPVSFPDLNIESGGLPAVISITLISTALPAIHVQLGN